jgi:hypothetical protein
MLPNVQQVTIKPVITQTVAPGSKLYTDEYDIYNRLPEWGYEHKSANHSAGEYARDEDGDGFHEVHVNTLEGSGPYCVPGCDLTEAFRRRNYRGIWASLSSSTTSAGAGNLCCTPCSLHS